MVTMTTANVRQDVSIQDLLEAGLHFGHRTKRWNPKMRKYLFGQKNGIYIIDLEKTLDGLQQARQFTDATDVTGVVLTKLDGSAKGGIVVQVQRELGVPVKLIGLGEGVDDLAPFDTDGFVAGLLGE